MAPGKPPIPSTGPGTGKAGRLILVNRVYWPSTAATAQLLTDLAEGLAARNWEVHVIAAGEAPESHNGVTIHRTGPGELHGGLISRTRNYWRFLRAARRRLTPLVRPDDVVVAMTDPPMLGASLGPAVSARGASLVHWIQDIYPEIVSAHVGAVAALPLLPLRRKRDGAWQAARACVTLGAGMAAAIASRGVAADRIFVVPNWAPRDLEARASAEAIAARRTAWGVAGKFVVAYSGNLGRVHEFSAVLDAAGRLQGHRDIVFLFIGAGARFEQIRAAAGRRNLGNVRLLPPEPREQLAAALAAADAHLVTLKPDFAPLVFPSKLAGALAAGRPILFVGPPEGEIARLLAHEQCGMTFGPADGARLAETIVRWQADRPEGEALGRKARVVYEQRFTFAAALARWEEVLQRVSGAR